MNEMFQLIGRAGRVGQSWTARAFLQPKGVEMLRRYISEGQKALNSEEARVFESFAESYLKHPTMELKSRRFYIQYVNEEEKEIEIVMRTHDNINECNRITEVVGLPYRKVNGKLELFVNVLPKTVETDPNVHLSISSSLLIDDVPTINVNGNEIIDVNLFYNNE